MRCKLGYTREDISELVDDPADFYDWMRGQTMVICDGWTYKHELGRYERSECEEEHGPVFFKWDVDRYLRMQNTGIEAWD